MDEFVVAKIVTGELVIAEKDSEENLHNALLMDYDEDGEELKLFPFLFPANTKFENTISKDFIVFEINANESDFEDLPTKYKEFLEQNETKKQDYDKNLH